MGLSMEREDKLIRMQWLIGLAASATIGLGYDIYEVQCMPSRALFPYYRLILVTLFLVGVLGFSFLLYRCAYRKPGTKLLFLVLLINGCSLIFSPLAFFSKIPLPSQISGSRFFLSMVMGGIWFVLCLRMRRLNQRLALSK